CNIVSVKVQSTSKPALRPIPLRSIGLSAGLLVLCTFTDTMLHAQFTIKTNNETVIVLDRFWKMTGYKVGDYVTKIKGDHKVTVRAVREVK
ncbi:MAG: hypothetical protein ACK5LH_05465, partial [Akkermansiaceae bacterium]